jgi:hypothetical protein
MSRRVEFDVNANSRATGFDETNRKILQQAALAKKASDDSNKQLKLLSTAIVGLGPAMVPIAAGAAALGAGFVGAAGVGLLAFKGLRDEWKAGTLQSTSLGKQITALQKNFDGITRTAAAGVAPGFTAGLKDINDLMPRVNTDVKVLSGQLGQIGGHLGAGVVTLFDRLNPLFVDLGDSLVKDSIQFQSWTKGSTAVSTFVRYAEHELPQVEATVKSLFVTASHVIEAFAPFGGVSLTTLRLFSETINRIPVGLLQELVPIFIGLKVANTVSAGVNNLGLALSRVGASAAAGGGGLRSFAGAIGGVTAVLGVALAAQQDFNTRGARGTQLALDLASEAARKFGVTTADVSTGVYGNDKAFQQLLGTLKANGFTNKQVIDTLTTLHDRLGATGGAVKGTAIATQQLTAAQKAANAVTAAHAQQLGVTAGAYKDAKTAADQHTKATEQATLAMRIEGDTAGLLKQKLDGLAGKTLSVAEAQLGVAEAVSAANEAEKQNGRTVDLNTKRGQANRSAINQMAESNRSLVTAQLQGVHSSTQANRIIDTANRTFEVNARKIYGAKSAAYAYAVQVGKIPHVASTAVTAYTKTATDRVADFQKKIRNLQGKDVPVNVVTRDNRLLALLQEQAAGRRGRMARGGRVPGYGGGDIFPAMLEPGETVVPKSLTPAIAPWAKAMGIPGFAAGGLVSGINLKMAGSRMIERLLNGILLPALTLTGAAPAQLQAFALSLFGRYGWGAGQLSPLVSLWTNESGWRYNALNPSSGAYGIPQALPASKMASAGPDWRTNPATQIRWGERYIYDVYGTPNSAWNLWNARQPHWYDRGGVLRPGVTLAVNRTGRDEYVSTRPPGGDTYITVNLNGAILGRADQVADDIAKVLERRSGRGKPLHVKVA